MSDVPGSEARPNNVRLPAGKRALVVEDNPINQIVADGMLRHLGMDDVAVASDGAQGLVQWAASRFDIVMMDCQMPVMDGYQATIELRRRGCRLPIIAMTASLTRVERERCLAAGMDDYLSKPVEPTEMEATLLRWLAPLTGPGNPMLVAPSHENAPAFDLQGALSRFMDDRELLGQAFGAFLETAPGHLADIDDGLASCDSARAQARAHSLAGSAATVGGEEVSGSARRLEHLAAAGDLDGARAELPRLRIALRALLDALREQLGAAAESLRGPTQVHRSGTRR